MASCFLSMNRLGTRGRHHIGGKPCHSSIEVIISAHALMNAFAVPASRSLPTAQLDF